MNRRRFITSVVAASAAHTMLHTRQAVAIDGVAVWSTSSPVIDLKQRAVTAIMADRGIPVGGLKDCATVSGFDSQRTSIEWAVRAPSEDYYTVSLILSSEAPRTMEVRSGTSVLTEKSLPRTWKDRPYYWRQTLPGTLNLKKGRNSIRFRVLDTGIDGVAFEQPADVTNDHPIFNEQSMAIMDQVKLAMCG